MIVRAWAVALTVLAGWAAAPGAQIFRSSTEVVRVDVAAVNRDGPVEGLTARDFEVFDNGVRQRVDLISTDSLPVFAVLVFDVSASMRGEPLRALKDAARRFLGDLDPPDAAALVTFGHQVQTAIGPLADVRAALDRTAASGNTSLVDGVAAGLALAASAGTGRPLLVVFSDGRDTASFLAASVVADMAARSDASIFAVAMEPDDDDGFLREVTRATGGRMLRGAGGAELAAAFSDILRDFRHRYVLGYVPQGVPAPGWHTIDVRVARPGVTLTHRPRYFRHESR